MPPHMAIAFGSRGNISRTRSGAGAGDVEAGARGQPRRGACEPARCDVWRGRGDRRRAAWTRRRPSPARTARHRPRRPSSDGWRAHRRACGSRAARRRDEVARDRPPRPPLARSAGTVALHRRVRARRESPRSSLVGSDCSKLVLFILPDGGQAFAMEPLAHHAADAAPSHARARLVRPRACLPQSSTRPWSPHVGFAVDQQPFVIPMVFARQGDTLLLHGAAASRLLASGARGLPLCVTVTFARRARARTLALPSLGQLPVVVLMGTAARDRRPRRQARRIGGVCRSRRAGPLARGAAADRQGARRDAHARDADRRGFGEGARRWPDRRRGGLHGAVLVGTYPDRPRSVGADSRPAHARAHAQRDQGHGRPPSRLRASARETGTVNRSVLLLRRCQPVRRVTPR